MFCGSVCVKSANAKGRCRGRGKCKGQRQSEIFDGLPAWLPMPSQGAGPPALGDCQSARGAAGGGCVSAGLAWGRCGASESTASTPPGEGTASALRTPLSSCACEGSASAPRTPRSAGPPTAGSLQYPSLQGPSLEHCGFPEVLRGPAAPWPTWGLGRCPRRRWCGFLSKGAGVANIEQSRRSSACDACGLPPRNEASGSSGGAAQPADSERQLVPHPPTTPPPQHLFDDPEVAL